ncbi:MAG: pseudouridylate synthase [Sphingobacteriaceae bacterium]|nr:MAG: pseudouridylate synthase [Sphingobacteriaceae bacterium]
MVLEILYQDEHLIAINKPHGLLVHRSAIARDVQEFALQILKNQIGKWVNPVHRIDRKTAGVLLFALDKDTERAMQMAFAENNVQKKYYAIVRGHTPDEQEIDYPLRKENGTLQEAFTAYKTLQRAELDVPLGAHPSSRYSLVEVKPETGRMHQLRKHFSHIFHPIIGDRTHGCNKQNRMFKANWQMETMLLHAAELSFLHPATGLPILIKAPLQKEFMQAMQLMNWNTDLTGS